MSYIDKTLLTGETVTYKAQVHWWVFVYPMKFLLFGLLLISFSSLYIKIPGYVLIAIALWGISSSRSTASAVLIKVLSLMRALWIVLTPLMVAWS
ncbi:PH domain protein [Porphyromonas gingivalis SJD11]|nr:PH domain protein [Porphyromonas gingivalis SJD11]